MTAQRCMLNAWPATLCVHAPVCHERRRRKEGATSLSEPMMDKHRWGARLIAGDTLGSGCCWMDGHYIYMCPRAKSIDIVSPRPLIRTPVTSSPIITYSHGPDVRLVLRYPLFLSLHLCTPVANATLVSYRRLVTSLSPFPRSDLLPTH